MVLIALRGRDVTRSDIQTGNSIQSLLLSPQQQYLVVTIQTAKKTKTKYFRFTIALLHTAMVFR